MHIIKLSATDSTNTYLRNLCNEENLKDYTVIVTNQQTKGRGQMGSVWESEANKNLIFSVFKDLSEFRIEHSFYLSMIVSLSILDALKLMGIHGLWIKWPNDILSDNKKICGILIENVVKNNKLSSAIIGIGLNVNQLEFNNLPNAASLKSATGINYNLDELLINILGSLTLKFDQYKKGEFVEFKQKYEEALYRINKPSTFQDKKGKLFQGIIQGVTNSGKLCILLEENVIEAFDHKEAILKF